MAHEYQKIIDLIVDLGLALDPGLHGVEIQHDDECSALSGRGRCDCRPIGFLPHKDGLHEFAIVNGEAQVVSINGRGVQ